MATNTNARFNKYLYLKALNGADLTHAEYRVLVTILNYSDKDGKNAHPGLARLTRECRMSYTHVSRCISSLKKKGYLWESSRGNRGKDSEKASVFELRLPGITCAESNQSTDRSLAPKSQNPSNNTCAENSTSLSDDHIKTVSMDHRSLPCDDNLAGDTGEVAASTEEMLGGDFEEDEARVASGLGSENKNVFIPLDEGQSTPTSPVLNENKPTSVPPSNDPFPFAIAPFTADAVEWTTDRDAILAFLNENHQE